MFTNFVSLIKKSTGVFVVIGVAEAAMSPYEMIA